MSEEVVKKFEEFVTTTSPRIRFRIRDYGWNNGDFHLFLWKLAVRREDPVRLRDDDKVDLCSLAQRLAEMLGKSLRRLDYDRDYELTYAIYTAQK